MKTVVVRLILFICFINIIGFCNLVSAAAPTCILMKFSDDTRYKRIEAAEALSDQVMEKLINSGRINLKETFPVDDQLERRLYDEKIKETELVREAFATRNFDIAFEDEHLNENRGNTIATTSLGQRLEPEIIKQIAEAHGAEYLIHGTIINLGTGDWWDAGAARIAKIVDTTSGLLGLVPVADSLKYLQGISVERTGIGVQCDLRIIDAKDGKVVWYKRVTAINNQKQIGVGLITFGSNKLTSSLYDKAINKAAQAIVDALVSDIDKNLLIMGQ